MTNDLIHVKVKDKIYFGYFAGFDRSTGAINVLVHDHDERQKKKGIFRIGVRNATSIDKLAVDVLGNVYRVAQEPRHELA